MKLKKEIKETIDNCENVMSNLKKEQVKINEELEEILQKNIELMKMMEEIIMKDGAINGR